MTLDPVTTTDADIRDYLVELQRTPKGDLESAYQWAVGGEEYTVNGVLKETMVRQILGKAIEDIGEFEIDGKTLAPSTLTINRFKECPDPSTNS